MLPNYLVIGAPKCGTTTLCDRLGRHPDVFMATPKEPHFFGRENREKTMDWYLSLFANTRGATAIGEGSTSYSRADIGPLAAKEILAEMPDCRLIYMVRHPIDRFESDWRMRRHEGWESESVNSAALEALAHTPAKPATQWMRRLLTQGLYWRNINEYRRVFSDEHILVVFLEDFAVSQKTELARCFEHIGVDPLVELTTTEVLNRSTNTRADGRIAGLLRGSALFSVIKARTPKWLLLGAKAMLTKKEQFVADWDPDVKQQVMDWYGEDTRQFLDFYGKPGDFWNLGRSESKTLASHG